MTPSEGFIPWAAFKTGLSKHSLQAAARGAALRFIVGCTSSFFGSSGNMHRTAGGAGK
jgi:hypothetical protein